MLFFGYKTTIPVMLSNISENVKIASSENQKAPLVLSDCESIRIEDNEDDSDFELTFLHVLTLNSMFKCSVESVSIGNQTYTLPIHINSCPIYIFSGSLVV